jgi:phospholipase/lecithinase/hemolysin
MFFGRAAINLQDIIFGQLTNPDFDVATGLENAVTDVASVFADLASVGATNILVPLIPDLGLTPIIRQGGPPLAAATLLTSTFDQLLDDALQDIINSSSNLNLFRFDSAEFLNTIVSDPAIFGFTNTSGSCYSEFVQPGGVTCTNPDEFIFWDGFHPTAAVHEILGNRIAAVVISEPGGIYLIILGILGLRLARKNTLIESS